jgi:3-deoxy-7-phosphoheptulonate synthase
MGLINQAWRFKPIKQDVIYKDREAVEKALAKLRRLPPIVTPAEASLQLQFSYSSLLKFFQIERLKKSLRDVALGKAFLLQGGVFLMLNTGSC